MHGLLGKDKIEQVNPKKNHISVLKLLFDKVIPGTKHQKFDFSNLGFVKMIEPDMTGQISSHDLPLCLDPPSFGWFGQYLNTTTVNYPIMGLCPSIILVWSIYKERTFLDLNASIMTPEKDRPKKELICLFWPI